MLEKYTSLINSQESTQEERLMAAQYLAANHPQDMNAVCEIDLHIHSFFSDGYHSPSGRVFEAWQRKMKAVSITDHDNFDGSLESIEAGRIFNIDVIPGIEFYTNRPGIEIIAYWPDIEMFKRLIDSGKTDELINPIKNAKKTQLSKMIARVPECMEKYNLDAEITDTDIKEYVRNGVSTKGDISVIMWQKYGPQLSSLDIAADVKEFQAKYTTQDHELNVPLEIDLDLSPEAFVKKIIEWQGLPGISHPTELRKKEGLGNAELYQIICDLGKIGLQTLEVDGWRNNIDSESGKPHLQLFNEMLERYNKEDPDRPTLIPTNGSDDHNQPGEGLELGCGKNRNLSPEFGRYNIIEKLRKRSQELYC